VPSIAFDVGLLPDAPAELLRTRVNFLYPWKLYDVSPASGTIGALATAPRRSQDRQFQLSSLTQATTDSGHYASRALLLIFGILSLISRASEITWGRLKIVRWVPGISWVSHHPEPFPSMRFAGSPLGPGSSWAMNRVHIPGDTVSIRNRAKRVRGALLLRRAQGPFPRGAIGPRARSSSSSADNQFCSRAPRAFQIRATGTLRALAKTKPSASSNHERVECADCLYRGRNREAPIGPRFRPVHSAGRPSRRPPCLRKNARQSGKARMAERRAPGADNWPPPSSGPLDAHRSMPAVGDRTPVAPAPNWAASSIKLSRLPPMPWAINSGARCAPAWIVTSAGHLSAEL